MTDRETKKPVPVVVVLHESWTHSIMRDCFTFCTVCTIIGVGVWVQSSAMQWTGFIMIGVMALARCIGRTKAPDYRRGWTAKDSKEAGRATLGGKP